MNPRDAQSRLAPDGEIGDTAARWLARRYGGLSNEEESAFRAWLAADPRHAAAVAELERAWQVISAPARAGQGAVAQERQRARDRVRMRARRRRATIASLTFAAAALLAVVFHPRFSPTPPAAARIVVQPNVWQLPDGSSVQLNAGAEIEPAFTPEKRLVRLLQGEALFIVAKDTARPFVVAAAGIEVKAVGTAFTVRFAPKQVDVLVTEGTVAVAAPETPAASGPVAPVYLSAGNHQVIPLAPDVAPTVAPVTPTQIATALAWRERRIEFTRTPLKEAVELFNRQNNLQLAVADTSTGNFEISGIFWADDPEGFVRLLEDAFEIHGDRSDRKVVLRKR